MHEFFQIIVIDMYFPPFDLLFPQLAPCLCVFKNLFSDIFSNMRFCFVRNNELFPIGIRGLILRCNDFNLIAAAEKGVERNDTSVHFRAYTMITDIGVYFESEIDRSGVARKIFQFAFRREDINFILIKIELETLH